VKSWDRDWLVRLVVLLTFAVNEDVELVARLVGAELLEGDDFVCH